MADCNFSISFTGDPESVVNKARSAVMSQGGALHGDRNSGQFRVKVFGSTIAGHYTISGNQMQVAITEKPFMIPCSTIESFLGQQLRG